MKRRDFLAAAPLGAVAMTAPAMAHTMTREEQIEHHKAELLRLYAETAPEGTVLSYVHLAMDGRKDDFLFLTAKRPDWTGREDPFWTYSSQDPQWRFSEVQE
mgnify:CR=1 FL=1